MHHDQPCQIVASEIELPLPLVDLGRIREDGREAELARLAIRESERPFDLEHAPLIRGQVYRLSDTQHVLLLVMHHSLCDGWSARVLIKEIAAWYESITTGSAPAVPELAVQYADFAAWQRRQIRNDAWQSQADYWQKKLAHAPGLIDLPTDRPRPAVQSSRGASQTLILPTSLVECLVARAREANAPLFMMLLAVFNVVLYRYTGQSDLVVGSPIAGRTFAELQPVVGFFANTLALRSDLSGDPTFGELLQRVRRTALEAYENQDLPFEELLAMLDVERDLSYAPLFQILFNMENLDDPRAETRELCFEEFGLDRGMAPYDLAVEVVTTERGTSVKFNYSSDLFDDATITRLMGHLHTMLESVAADPKQRLSQLPMLTDAERHQLLIEWNDTRADYPTDACIHELFEAQVERTPDGLAVLYAGGELTFGDLNARANQLAHHLRTKGVGPEAVVAVALNRSPEAVIAFMAVLKAGGAFLPLDPNWPPERLAYMIQDSRAVIVLARGTLAAKLAGVDLAEICLDLDVVDVTAGSRENPAPIAGSDNLAYVVYTSGSTGEPKGVMVPHRCMVNYAWFRIAHLDLRSSDRKLQFGAPGTELFVAEVSVYLLSGASLYVQSGDLPPSIAAFTKLLDDNGITLVTMPSAYFHEWCTTLSRGEQVMPPSLRIVATGMDKVDPEQFRFWQRRVGDRIRWSNTYGPAETTCVATIYDADLGSDLALPRVPIGRPIANTQVYVVDEFMNPVPVGVPGEVFIGGHGVSRGYINRAQLTAEKFLADPFSERPNARFYRTGDRARYLPDGNLDFLGRADQQVKVRGFRIELGEIEAALKDHEDVRDAVVVAKDDPSGDKRLVAYLIADQAASDLRIGEVRGFLSRKLPQHMLPAAVVMLDEWPLTPTGKVDRLALPAPESSRPDLGNEFLDPRTPVEETLAAIWAEVLKVEQVGVYDNFFELGGHSLAAAQVANRVRDTFAADLPVQDVFEYPVLAELAASIGERVGGVDNDKTATH